MLAQSNKDKVPYVISFCIPIRVISQEMNKASYSLILEGWRSFIKFIIILIYLFDTFNYLIYESEQVTSEQTWLYILQHAKKP